MRISAIIPTHNRAGYLPEAIASVRAQEPAKGVETEIIIVDDGSTDDTAGVAERYGASVRFVRQMHAGAAVARNHGVSLATGNMIAFLDADDVWLPQKLALQMAWLETRSHLDMVFCHAKQFISEDAMQHATAIPDRLRVLPAMVAGGLLAWRKAFDRVGALDASYTRTDFIDWLARANGAGLKHDVLPQMLLRRRWHDHNQGVTRLDKVTDYTRVVKAVLDRRRAASQSS